MFACEVKICQGDVPDRISTVGGLIGDLSKSNREFPETFNGDCRHNRVSVLEVRV